MGKVIDIVVRSYLDWLKQPINNSYHSVQYEMQDKLLLIKFHEDHEKEHFSSVIISECS